jgi:FkbM family methyltransferase
MTTTTQRRATQRPSRTKLRPEKIKNASRRRWFEHQLERVPLRDAAGIVQLGNPHYGSWVIPGAVIEPSWICYSVGAGGNVEFDLDLVERYGVRLRSFDAVADYVQQAEQSAADEPRFSAHHAAIAAVDGPVRMQVTHDPQSRSVSPAGLYESNRFVELPGRSLRSLMQELGDERIDLLKLDIEGGEYALLPALDLRSLGVKVFATQLHHTGSVQDARSLIAGLADQGYEPVACKPAVKIAFAHRDLL